MSLDVTSFSQCQSARNQPGQCLFLTVSICLRYRQTVRNRITRYYSNRDMFGSDLFRRVVLRTKICRLVAVLFLCSIPTFAQSEMALKEFFEGKRVTVRIDMPGSSDGVDLNIGSRQELNYNEYGNNIKRYGVAIRTGDSVTITKIKVKGKSIEFQLGGGGFGTLGDDTSTTVSVQSVPKSQREKDLERDLKNTSDPDDRRRINRELDNLRDRRSREDARNQALAAEASERKREAIAQKRLEGGSRFNLKYDAMINQSYLTPEGIMESLAKYIYFPAEDFRGAGALNRRYGGDPTTSGGNDRGSASPAEIRKGMTIEEVTGIYGRPINSRERMEGTLRVTVSTFSQSREQILEAEFVEGVLVRYRISSR